MFISRRLNSKGQSFGFVRFQGVSNAQDLKIKLDAIWISNVKLHVNID